MAGRRAYIGLGSNQGDRARLIAEALSWLAGTPGVRVLRVSRLVQTEAMGGPTGQRHYLNAVAELECEQEPGELLGLLLEVETKLGRVRQERWGPRKIDLDLLLYEQEVVETTELVLPHPRMHERRFVMGPLAEIAPEAMHPVLGKTVGQIWQELDAK